MKRPSVTAPPRFSDQYVVKPKDTLYSIAFRFGMDYQKLAAANHIEKPYRILVGQQLVLKEAALSRNPTPVIAVKPVTSKQTTPKQQDTKVYTSVDSSIQVANKPTSASIGQWKWPHNGQIVQTFSSNVGDQKGIDLEGEIGDSVLAANGGAVVYAGNGLPGYGNLIIIEHPNSLLSAYAFAQDILVREKDQVEPGQKIATMGKQGDQPRLHFEIRQNGKPIDPLKYLPAR